MQRQLVLWISLLGLIAVGAWFLLQQPPATLPDSEPRIGQESADQPPTSLAIAPGTPAEPLRMRVEDGPDRELAEGNADLPPVESGRFELSVRVVDPFGAPRPGVVVTTQRTERSPRVDLEMKFVGTTDEDGEARRNVQPGKRKVFANLVRGVPRWTIAESEVDVRGDTFVELTMHPLTAAIDVAVVDHANVPVVGVLVGTGRVQDGMITDDDGRARLENQPTGKQVFVKVLGEPEHLRFTMSSMQTEPLAAGDNAVTLRLERQARLVLELSQDLRARLDATDEVVVTANATPMAEARLTLEAPRCERWVEAGSHRFGTRTFHTRTKVAGSADTVLQLAPGSTTLWIIEPIGGSEVLEGRFVGPEGIAVRDLAVTLWFPQLSLSKQLIPAEDGSFRFTDLPASTDARLGYLPAIGSEWRYQGDGGLETSRRRVTVPASGPLTIELKRGFTIQGEIRRNGTRITDDRACPRIEIDWAHARDQPWTAQGTGGRYRFTNLRPGTYRIRWTGQTEWQHTVAFDENTSEPALTLDLDVD